MVLSLGREELPRFHTWELSQQGHGLRIEVLTHKEQLLQSILGLEVNTAVTSHKTKQGNSLS